jgi:hypothetical protein
VALSGNIRATVGGRVSRIETAQQLIISPAGDILISDFIERDPWYRTIAVVGEGTGHIIGLEGSAEIQSEGIWLPAEIDMPFLPGSVAKTAAASWLEIRFDDNNVIRLQASSEVALLALEDLADGSRQSKLELRAGKIWVIIESQDQPFEIETPGLIAGARGTKFRLDSPTGDQPPLIKTFEGTVTGYLGFEAIEVAENQQFDLLAGVTPLVLDALDEFNLQRDLFLNRPSLSITALPSVTASRSLSISGETNAPAIQTNATTIATEDGQFSFDVTLASGLNLIDVVAQWVEDGPKTSIVIPVIRSGRDALLFLDEPQSLTHHLVRLSGISDPGASITVTGLAKSYQTVAGQDGRFSLLVLVPAETRLTISTSNTFGEQSSEERLISLE